MEDADMKFLSKRQSFVLAALSVLIGSSFAYVYITADPPGYCRAQQRHITDEEFIRASAALLDWDMNRTHSDGTKYKDFIGAYKDIDFDPDKRSGWRVSSTDFYGDNLQSFFRRFLGWQEVFVTWHVKTHATPRDIDTSNIDFRYTVCGELRDSTMGLPRMGNVTTTNYLEITNSK
jgi:hypothetical protein